MRNSLSHVYTENTHREGAKVVPRFVKNFIRETEIPQDLTTAEDKFFDERRGLQVGSFATSIITRRIDKAVYVP